MASGKKKHISELGLSEAEIRCFTALKKPMNSYEVAAKLGMKYQTAITKLGVWRAHKWVVKITKLGGGSVYKLNEKELEA